MDSIIAAIDVEISRLKQVRSLLSQKSGVSSTALSKRGRKAGSVAVIPAKSPAKKRTLSPEARKAIGDAQRKRWAAAKKVLKSDVPLAVRKRKETRP
jgi:hypothetical protein